MWLTVLLIAAGLTYATYRIGMVVAAARADRSGDAERGQQLRLRGNKVFLGALCVFALGVCIAIIVAVASP